jgi:hypothetical protein
MAVSGNTVTEVGDSLLISLSSPYLNVISVQGYVDVVEGEDTNNYFIKEFRWSVDNAIYSDYADLTDANLQALLLDPNQPFWIQYKYTCAALETGHTLTFESISLEVVTQAGTIEQLPQYDCCNGAANDPCANLVIECCGAGPWDPYAVQNNNYNMLSQVVSNLFGFCVSYYKTAADQRSKDVILREYSLFNVIDSSNDLKILIPDNALPTKDIQFGPLGLDIPVLFEVHIVKTEFERVFGKGTHPAMRDYLYFPKMNRMYEVNAIAESDDFMYQSSYWRVSLAVYQERTNIGFTDLNIEAEVDALTTNLEEAFGVETNLQETQVRKPNQYRTVGTGSNDYVRRILDKKLLIRAEKLYNNYTIVAKYLYELGTISEQQTAVEYRYTGGIETTENRAFTFWVRPKYINAISGNISITVIGSTTIDGNVRATFTTAGANGLAVGNVIRVAGTQDYNGIQIIEAIISPTQFVIKKDYVSAVAPNPRYRAEKIVRPFAYENDLLQRNFSFAYTPSAIIIEFSGRTYVYDLNPSGLLLAESSWYAFVINVSNEFNQLSLFIWESEPRTGQNSASKTSDLKNIFQETKALGGKYAISNSKWKLLGSAGDITNLRIFVDPIQIEEQSLILCQYVVQDNQLAALIDNATPELKLPTVNNPR